jgi:hypothetical protein
MFAALTMCVPNNMFLALPCFALGAHSIHRYALHCAHFRCLLAHFIRYLAVLRIIAPLQYLSRSCSLRSLFALLLRSTRCANISSLRSEYCYARILIVTTLVVSLRSTQSYVSHSVLRTAHSIISLRSLYRLLALRSAHRYLHRCALVYCSLAHITLRCIVRSLLIVTLRSYSRYARVFAALPCRVNTRTTCSTLSLTIRSAHVSSSVS